MKKYDIRILTSNIFYPTQEELTNGLFKKRCDSMINIYKNYMPDIIIINEASIMMYSYLFEQLKGIYSEAGVCLESPGENDIKYNSYIEYIGKVGDKFFNGNQILYHHDRFIISDSGVYLYKIDTLKKWGGTDGGVPSFRNITWVKFKELGSNREIFVYATHLNPYGSCNKTMVIEAGELVTMISEKKQVCDVPVFICGDFNSTISDSPLKCLMENGMNDALVNAIVKSGEQYASCHKIGENPPEGEPYDHVMFCNKLQCRYYELILGEDMINSSDHNFVFADFSFKD